MSQAVSQPKAQHILRHGELFALIPILAAAISLASLLLLVQTSRVASEGYNLRHLEQVRDDWQQINSQLEAEIATLQSLERIEREARNRLKMVPATEYIYVTVDKPSQVNPTPELLPPSRAKEQGEKNITTWWQTFLHFMPFLKETRESIQ